jgi:hypothetical protein
VRKSKRRRLNMKRIRAKFAIAAAAALLTAAAPAFALGDGPGIASDWADLTVPQAECFARGEAAIQRIGFGEAERTKYSRFGTR